MNEQRRARLKDFETRARVEPEAIFRDELLGTYIAIHPMADEDELLARLGVSREACAKVDCYWKHEGEVYFLQVETSGYAHRDAGLWARISPGEPPYVNLVGVIEEHQVTRAAVHRIMRLFKSILGAHLQLTEELVRVD